MRRIILSENELHMIFDCVIERDTRFFGPTEKKVWISTLKEIARTLRDDNMLVDPLTGDLINED